MTAAGLSSAAELMLNMPASEIGIKRYRQNRLVAFMVSSIGFRGLKCRRVFGVLGRFHASRFGSSGARGELAYAAGEISHREMWRRRRWRRECAHLA
jgi:hypothetical protein